MKSTQRHLDTTRRAILDALAHVIVESTGFGFSVQQVASRAGVTHRTVYNHFPTREALSDALAEYTEERLSRLGPPPETTLPSFWDIADAIDPFYRGLATEEVHARAYVMLMMANRRPARIMSARTRRAQEFIAQNANIPAGLGAAELTAVVRLFLSTMGWHTLTEHLGLSVEQAAAAATWATRTLVDAIPRRAEPTPRRRSRSAGKAKSHGKANPSLKPRATREEQRHGRRTR
jgi:AcrR family transcriptional regulator